MGAQATDGAHGKSFLDSLGILLLAPVQDIELGEVVAQPQLLVAAKARSQVEVQTPPLEGQDHAVRRRGQRVQDRAAGVAAAEVKEGLAGGCNRRPPAQVVVAAVVVKAQVHGPGRAEGGVELIDDLPHVLDNRATPAFQLP